MTAGYVDTNILIDYFAGREEARAALEKFSSLKAARLPCCGRR